MEQSKESVLRGVFFLAEESEETLRRIASDPGCTEKTFQNGEVVFSPSSFTPALVLVREGRVLVWNESGGNRVLLNSIGAGGIFGAAGLFGTPDEYVTTVTAKGKTSLLFLSAPLCERILRSSPEAAMRYVAFLSDRIRFLNGRIGAFTAGSAEAKTAGYLLGADPAKPINFARLSDTLGIGRASLYRALDSLAEKGLIVRDGKFITIPDREALAEEIK